MKTIIQNVRLSKLLDTLNLSSHYATYIVDKEEAARNLERMCSLPDGTIKLMEQKGRRNGYYNRNSFSFMDEGTPSLSILTRACITDEAALSFVEYVSRYCKRTNEKATEAFLGYTGNILSGGLLSSFKGIDSDLMVLCFLKAYEAGPERAHGDFAFLLYLLKKDRCTVLSEGLAQNQYGSNISNIALRKEEDGSYSVSVNSRYNDEEPVPVKCLEVLEELRDYPDLFQKSLIFLLRLAVSCQDREFLEAVKLVLSVIPEDADPVWILERLSNTDRKSVPAISDAVRRTWEQVVPIAGKEARSLMKGILYMEADFSFNPDVMHRFARNIGNASMQELKDAADSKTVFLNICDKSRFRDLADKVDESRKTVYGLVLYAMEQKKTAFLKLAETQFKLLEAVPDGSILFHADFRRFCNLNTLSAKDLQLLANKKEGCEGYNVREGKLLFPYLPEKKEMYTFQELYTLAGKHPNFQKIYRKLAIPGIDKRLLAIRQLMHKDLKVPSLTDAQCDTLALHISEKLLPEWKEQFSGIDGIQGWQVVKLVSLMDGDLTGIIRDARDITDVNIILNNATSRELVSSGLKAFRRDFMQKDRDSCWLLGMMSIPEADLVFCRENILSFCTSGYASIVRKYYDHNTDEQIQENVLLIAKAAMLGRMDRLKYERFWQELQYQAPEKMVETWKAPLSMENRGLHVAEYDDFFHCMSIGVLTGHTCMSYEDGVYSECLLSCFDGNKKILYVKDGDDYCARAILRLTKFTDRKDGNGQELAFTDVTEEKKEEAGQERLVLFLERPYTNRISEDVQADAIRQLAALAGKKASAMGLELVVAHNYREYLPVVPVSGYLYISRSKNGLQYLDSLGGKCEKGGTYKSGNFLFWQEPKKPEA